MKFGALKEYNTRNIFNEKSFTRCGEEASPKALYKKIKNLTISLDQQLNVI